MAKILISPSKYVQGAGEMKKLGTYAAEYGKKALVLICPTIASRYDHTASIGKCSDEGTDKRDYFLY